MLRSKVVPTTSLAGMPDPAIDCRELVVRYGALVAVDGLSLPADSGRVLALLGPNGAGKTSTVETLEGYRRPSAGTVRVLGHDPVVHHRISCRRIGVMLQRGGVYPTMSRAQGGRALRRATTRTPRIPTRCSTWWVSARWPGRRGGVCRGANSSASRWPSRSWVDRRWSSSTSPPPAWTPKAASPSGQSIAALRERGTCVVLTTHELPEAERLADEVVIVNHGRAVARGTVAELSAAGGGSRIQFAAPPGVDVSGLAATLGGDAGSVFEQEPGRYVVSGQPTPARLGALAGWLAEHDLPLADLHAGGGTLEEAYLELTRSSATHTEGASDDSKGSGAPVQGGLSHYDEGAKADPAQDVRRARGAPADRASPVSTSDAQDVGAVRCGAGDDPATG